MATSLTFLTPKTNNPTSKTAMENETKPVVIKSNKGRKPTGKGPYQKKEPQRGMGVEKLERLRIQETLKKMTETSSTPTPTPTPTAATTTTQFPTDHHLVGDSNVHVLHHSVGVPMMINGGGNIGGLWGWGSVDTGAGFMIQRVAANGGFPAGLNGQVLVNVGPATSAANVQFGYAGSVGDGVVEASKELSSMPKLQHCKPDRCDVCFKKKKCNGEKVRFNIGGFNQYGQLLGAKKAAGFHEWNQMENHQNVEHQNQMNGFCTAPRAERGTSVYAGQGHMNNINENVDVVAIHRKGNSIGNGSVVMEYEFFPGKSSRSTSSKKWELPAAEASVAVGGEASYAYPSNCVDLSLKL